VFIEKLYIGNPHIKFRFYQTPGGMTCLCLTAAVFSALTLFVGLQEVVGAGVVICLERGADLHMIPLPLTVSCFSKIQISFTFLILAYPGSPGKGH